MEGPATLLELASAERVLAQRPLTGEMVVLAQRIEAAQQEEEDDHAELTEKPEAKADQEAQPDPDQLAPHRIPAEPPEGYEDSDLGYLFGYGPSSYRHSWPFPASGGWGIQDPTPSQKSKSMRSEFIESLPHHITAEEMHAAWHEYLTDRPEIWRSCHGGFVDRMEEVEFFQGVCSERATQGELPSDR